MCVHITFTSVWVAEWPTFWKELLTRLNICSLCILTICNFSYFPFWFRGLELGSNCFSYFLQHITKNHSCFHLEHAGKFHEREIHSIEADNSISCHEHMKLKNLVALRAVVTFGPYITVMADKASSLIL